MDKYEFVLNDFLRSLNERKIESDKLCKENANDLFELGRNLAYTEFLEMLESRMRVYDIDEGVKAS